MSFGLLSRWYDNLKPLRTRNLIADVYRLDPPELASWLRNLCLVRNVAAHHSRLWNRSLSSVPMRPRFRPTSLIPAFQTDSLGNPSPHIYNSLIIMAYLLDMVSPGHSWRARFKDVMARHTVPLADMGFPTDWLTRPVWQDMTP